MQEKGCELEPVGRKFAGPGIPSLALMTTYTGYARDRVRLESSFNREELAICEDISSMAPSNIRATFRWP